MNAKQIAGEKAVDFIKEGMTVGLGTGSTVYYTIRKIKALIQNGFHLNLISTSHFTTQLAQQFELPLINIEEVDEIDLTIDGADEVDPYFNGIKGGGGALLFEKIVARASKKNIWVIDSGKHVDYLGRFPLPVEVVSFGYRQILNQLHQKGFQPQLRVQNGETFITDGNHYIIDLYLNYIPNSIRLEQELNLIPGIVDNGLFNNLLDVLVEGSQNTANIYYRP